MEKKKFTLRELFDIAKGKNANCCAAEKMTIECCSKAIKSDCCIAEKENTAPSSEDNKASCCQQPKGLGPCC